MSGTMECPEIDIMSSPYLSLQNPENISWNWNPLNCLICNQSLTEPLALACHHVFCRACVLREIQNGAFRCPLCAKTAEAVDEKKMDMLVNFLVESANEPSDVCANCDNISQPMFFCETCQQALCQICKENTHQAKMFSAHKLVPHEERASLRGRRLCPSHNEPYILFSTESKRLICINCFRKASLESRSHYVDVEVGHKMGCEKLEKMASKLKKFQQDLKDQIQIRLKLLDELSESSKSQTAQIQQTCQQMIDSLIQVRDNLLKDLAEEERMRQVHFTVHLRQLCSLLPSVQLYLLSASIVYSSASKQDFLQLAYDLMKRIQNLLNDNQAIKPLFTGQIDTNHRDEFAKALEPYLGMSSLFLPSVMTIGQGDKGASGSASPTYSARRNGKRSGSGYVNCPNLPMSKYQLMVDLAGAFGEEFAKIDTPVREFSHQLIELSKQIQEMQRDMTLRRCIIDKSRLEHLMSKCRTLDEQLGCHSVLIQELQPHLQQIWQEQLDRVRRQQHIFRQRVETSIQVRSDLRHVIQAANQLEPFVNSIASVASTIDPRRCHPPDPAPMERICSQITSLAPNSELRVNAIEKEEQNRKQREQEGRSDYNPTLLAVKKHLKTTKDHQHRKNKQNNNTRNVGRDRSRGGTDHGLLSPGKRHQKTSVCSSRQTDETASDQSSLDDSFEQVLSIVQQTNDKDINEKEANNVKLTRSATVNINKSEEKGECFIKMSSSLPDDDHLTNNMTSLHIRSLSGAESEPEQRSPNVPKVPKVPPTLIKIIEPSTLEAREKLLQSLKEKVPRIEIGVSNSPVREIPVLENDNDY